MSKAPTIPQWNPRVDWQDTLIADDYEDVKDLYESLHTPKEGHTQEFKEVSEKMGLKDMISMNYAEITSLLTKDEPSGFVVESKPEEKKISYETMTVEEWFAAKERDHWERDLFGNYDHHSEYYQLMKENGFPFGEDEDPWML